MKIINSTPEDIDAIFALYDEAVAYQKLHYNQHWQGFEVAMVQKEINEKWQWKIIDQDQNILCIFATAFSDPVIWEEKDKDPSIYLHRIVTNPIFRGKNYVNYIIEWAKEYALQHNIKFIRMDTWGKNEKLINYYKKCGFNFIGLTTPAASSSLPKHYSAALLSLFEIEVKNN